MISIATYIEQTEKLSTGILCITEGLLCVVTHTLHYQQPIYVAPKPLSIMVGHLTNAHDCN